MNDVSEEARQVLAEAECLCSFAQAVHAMADVAARLNADFATRNPLVITIMNGGLVFAGQLLPLLTIPLQQDYLHATRYRDSTSGCDLQWRAKPQSSLRGRHVLLVDDIFDEGITLAEVIRYCREEGAASVATVVLCNKIHGRKVPGLTVDYAVLTVPDRYVFGFGMDYKGYLRNAAGIFALREG